MIKTPPTFLQRPALWIATLGPVGLMRPAPGTWASLAAVVAAPFVFLPLPFEWRVCLLLALFVIGGVCAGLAEKHCLEKDPSKVVVDELLGQWITFLPFFSPDVLLMSVGFALFRFFDILKPPPVRASETWLPGGFGVMLDDVLAGVYAAALLWVAGLAI